MPFQSLPISEFLRDLASRTPAPGGGAAACVTGSVGAALASMVVAYSLGKKSLEGSRADLEDAARSLELSRAEFLDLADEDARAYAVLNGLLRLPEDDARRRAELPAAAWRSAEVPLRAIRSSLDMLRLLERLAPITNVHLHSDLGIAAVLAESAAASSRWNVLVNADLLARACPDRANPLTEADDLLAEVRRLRASVEALCGAVPPG